MFNNVQTDMQEVTAVFGFLTPRGKSAFWAPSLGCYRHLEGEPADIKIFVSPLTFQI